MAEAEGVLLRQGFLLPPSQLGLWDYAVRCHYCNVDVFENIVAVVVVVVAVSGIDLLIGKVAIRFDPFSTGLH